MRNSLIAKLIVFLLLYPFSINSVSSKDNDNLFLGTQLEIVLNQKKYNLIKNLFHQKSFNQFNKQYLDFNKRYKDAKWSIKTIKNNENSSILEVKITSKREIGGQTYNLNSKQTVKIETFKSKIKNYQIINEESILNSKNSPLIVKIVSPEKVLTGERYEMNLIIEKPLDKSLIASGIIVLKNKENINISNDRFEIKPNQSGGLFKYIQAPLEPGFQTISAIITHPEGIYSNTKKIKGGL